MDQIVHEVRRANWASIISECSQSTLTKLEWCRQNGISIKSFYYWQRKLRVRGKMILPSHGKEFFHCSVSTF